MSKYLTITNTGTSSTKGRVALNKDQVVSLTEMPDGKSKLVMTNNYALLLHDGDFDTVLSWLDEPKTVDSSSNEDEETEPELPRWP